MKLIYCRSCKDIVRIYRDRRSRRCGKSWGQYLLDGLHATYGGEAVPVGINNTQFHSAVRLHDEHPGGEPEGMDFAAFVCRGSDRFVNENQRSKRVKDDQCEVVDMLTELFGIARGREKA